jgi:hypothetical protein
VTRDAESAVRERHGGAALAVAYFLPPIAVLLQLEIVYLTVSHACRHGTAALHVESAVAFAAVLVGVLTGRRVWEEAGGGWDMRDADRVGGRRFLAGTGTLLGSLCLLVSLAMWLPIFFLDPCR